MDSVEAVVEKVPLRARAAAWIPALRAFGFVAAVGLVVYMGIRAAQDVDVSVLANDVETTQTAEIGLMRQMLQEP